MSLRCPPHAKWLRGTRYNCPGACPSLGSCGGSGCLLCGGARPLLRDVCVALGGGIVKGHRRGHGRGRPLRPPSPPTCPSPTPTALFRGRCRGLKDHRTRLSLRFRNGAVRFHTFFRFGEPESRRRKPISPHLISGDSDTHVAREGLKRKRLTFSKRFLEN